MPNDIKTRKSIPNKFTNEDLIAMQNWDLDRKIAVSLTKISEFYNHFPHKIFVLRYVILYYKYFIIQRTILIH